MTSSHDAIVVGAGPAGATAARRLAAAGVRTLLIDRATFPRYKACGGAITTRALARFPYLRTALDAISTHWISKLVLQAPRGRSAELRSPSLSSEYRTAFRGRAYSLQSGLVNLLKRDGILAGDSRREHFTPFLIPVGGPIRHTGTRRVLVAGDAGGFVNGFSAEGIYYAMVSGDLAASAVTDALANGVPAHTTYRARWKAEIGKELEESVVFQRFFFAAGAQIDALVDEARRAPAMVSAVTQWAAGTASYGHFRRRLVTGHPAVGIVLGAILLRKKLEATRHPVFQSEHE